MYKAHGSSFTWEWLDMITPCIGVLCDIACRINNMLGANIGTRHAPADLRDDINMLMQSLDEHDMYCLRKGRELEENKIVIDAITMGLQALTDAIDNPIPEPNEPEMDEEVIEKVLETLEGVEASEQEPMLALSTAKDVAIDDDDDMLEVGRGDQEIDTDSEDEEDEVSEGLEGEWEKDEVDVTLL
ncbi:hypothetical protein K435DRAFT_781965 [Dendrothele bispora CBS 962.96]|uniref:DUF6589 domain-containing protein n=1 Tax=Dendrothele bispora (strain CBS 962.96) TaxID=1314807 RepID=A0A4S8LJ67_DENBC|nr:hypothetical protein K435DRAFT_781965 [Dendrothele bispora CBS 962.96]